MSVWPAWEVQEHGGATSWLYVRLAFPDDAWVDALAVVSEGCVSIEDIKAQPALSLADLTALADWIEEPLFEACAAAQKPYDDEGCPPARGGEEGAVRVGPRRARPAWPRGIEGCRLVAEEYRAAQEGGGDPVLAVMCATGHSRRRSLGMIAQARDAGFLTPRHARC
ncbi:DUF6214 family protein [Streptomyces sp. NPDC002671]